MDEWMGRRKEIFKYKQIKISDFAYKYEGSQRE